MAQLRLLATARLGGGVLIAQSGLLLCKKVDVLARRGGHPSLRAQRLEAPCARRGCLGTQRCRLRLRELALVTLDALAVFARVGRIGFLHRDVEPTMPAHRAPAPCKGLAGWTRQTSLTWWKAVRPVAVETTQGRELLVAALRPSLEREPFAMGLQPPPTVGVASNDKKVSHQASARISQQTFDEAVRENMAELDMEEDEAVQDAISQFEAQGIDLSNILKQAQTAERDAHPVLRGLAALADATRAGTDTTRELTFGEGSSQSTMRLMFKSISLSPGGSGQPLAQLPEDEANTGAGAGAGAEGAIDGLAQALDALGSACGADGEDGVRNCALLGSNDGVDALSSACLALLARPELPSALRALTAGLRSVENREQIGIRGLLALYAVLLERPHDAPVQAAAFHAAAAAMVGSEANRVTLHEKCRIIPLIAAALRAHGAERSVVLAACAALRGLTLQDDGRIAVNKGFDRARAAAEVGCLPLLAKQLAGAAGSPADLSLACALLSTLSRLTASAKICARRTRPARACRPAARAAPRPGARRAARQPSPPRARPHSPRGARAVLAGRRELGRAGRAADGGRPAAHTPQGCRRLPRVLRLLGRARGRRRGQGAAG